MFTWLRAASAPAIAYPPGPPGLTLYAIGDIHGRLDCLERAHLLIDRDSKRRSGAAAEIYLGDYVDRGPDSKGVIDLLLRRSTSVRTCFLTGNHELIMDSFLRGETPFEDWRTVGGLETLLSYGVEAQRLFQRAGPVGAAGVAEKIPASHRQFLATLEKFRVFGGYCFVHAGLKPGVPLERQSLDDLVWIRDEFLDFTGDFGFVVVHGHTPVAAVDLLPNRVNVDTGAFATNRLSVIRIDADGLAVLSEEPT